LTSSKVHARFLWHSAFFLLILFATISLLSFLFVKGTGFSPFFPFPKEVGAELPSGSKALSPQIILDAGHGGEDPGAISVLGTKEKDLNLAVTKKVGEFLEALGIRVEYTRLDDCMLSDGNTSSKKSSDLRARVEIAKQFPDATFVSIHMNAYPLPQYSGLQVWYSKHHPESHTLADTLQSNAQRLLQPQNNRKTKAAGSNIYLLHHLTCPAILVECGFLSNAAEAEQLNTPEYQKELAFVIALSILEARDQ